MSQRHIYPNNVFSVSIEGDLSIVNDEEWPDPYLFYEEQCDDDIGIEIESLETFINDRIDHDVIDYIVDQENIVLLYHDIPSQIGELKQQLSVFHYLVRREYIDQQIEIFNQQLIESELHLPSDWDPSDWDPSDWDPSDWDPSDYEDDCDHILLQIGQSLSVPSDWKDHSDDILLQIGESLSVPSDWENHCDDKNSNM